MKNLKFPMRIWLLSCAAAVAVGLCLGACAKQPSVQAEVADLEKAFSAAAEPAPAKAEPVSPSPVRPTEAHELVQAAVSAARASDYVGGVIALDEAQRKPGLTAEQVMAAQRAKQAMTTELINRAAAGDQQALAQLKAIEKTRSQ